MALAKTDSPEWEKIHKRVGERMAHMQSSHVPQTMTSLQASLVGIQARKNEIEVALSALAAKKAGSAWKNALAGDVDTAVEGRNDFRTEYAALEQRERVVESAIEEGRLEIDKISGQVSLAICHELKADYLKGVVPRVRAAALQMLEAMEVEQQFVDLLSEHGVRYDHLGRIAFPMILTRESLEKFLHELGELA